jgi:hypothetical protein
MGTVELNAGVDGTEHYTVNEETGEVRQVFYDAKGKVTREELIPAAAAKRVRAQKDEEPRKTEGGRVIDESVRKKVRKTP